MFSRKESVIVATIGDGAASIVTWNVDVYDGEIGELYSDEEDDDHAQFMECLVCYPLESHFLLQQKENKEAYTYLEMQSRFVKGKIFVRL